MNGYEIYSLYMGMKMHFTSKSYDFYKYNGVTRGTNPDNFELRKDKYMFHKLARKLNDGEVLPFLLSNFLVDRKAWTRNLVQPEAFDNYRRWCKTRDSLNYTFETDLRTILKQGTLTEAIQPKADGEFPTVLVQLLQKEITIETVSIIHAMTHCLNVWDQKYKDNYIYEENVFVIRKYLPFLSLDIKELKEIAKRVLTET